MKGGLTYHVYNVFFSGIATIADSLAAIDHVVFQEKKLSYAEYMDIVEHNFEGHEDLRLYVQSLPKYGNDTDVDQYVTRVADTFLSVVEQIELLPNRYAIPGFYSLDKDNRWGKDIPATPDGRLAGEGFSENQSPVYGADKNGITALLNSVSKIPLQRTATGGFNLTFSRAVEPEILKGLITTFFQKGGLHVGITVLKREELEEAMVNPDKYKGLTVRLYGFSEYFINLPDWQQKAVLNRTAY
jgi:formate C-acetyltransferase